MTRNFTFSIAIIFLSGIIFTGCQWYAHYKMKKDVERMNLEREQIACDCWTSHAENALSAYQQGNDSLLREIIRFTQCEEGDLREEGFGLRHSSWSIYFDHLKSCEYKNIDSLQKFLFDALKPGADADCAKCLSLIHTLDYISDKNSNKWQRSNFLYYCYPFYGMDVLRSKYIELHEDITFVRAYDSTFSEKFDSIAGLIRNHEMYDSLRTIQGMPRPYLRKIN
ncbi:MAG: hypothetical protein IPN97_09820 [Saprospiraceae bacterium]|nr:hypothetical protein [Saprospiraceae bacterium]